jgi:hypothetical protein
MDNSSFKSQLDQAKSILILLPTKPYFDQVASGLSLFLALRSFKDINIVCPSDMLVEFNKLVGVDKVSSDFGNRNLVIKFSDYKATDIERVSYDIENGEFRLSVIPKPEVNPPDKQQIKMSYSGISADLVILVGGANETHFPEISGKELAGVSKLHIGTRQLAVSAGQEVLSLASQASSISELVYTLLKQSGIELDTDIATNLLLGIEVATNHYSTDAVSADTFQTVADLLRIGARRAQKEPRQSFPPGAIPGEVLQQRPATKQEELGDENPPKDWLGPKIYKGTSVS